MGTWLVDETKPLDAVAEASIAASIQQRTVRGPGSGGTAVALRLNDVIIHDTKKWFGGADIRIDAIVVNGTQPGADGYYQPSTFRFPGVKDGDRLPIETPGLAFFYGKPSYFLDVSIMVSRDKSDSKDLGDLIQTSTGSTEWKTASSALLALAVAAPQAALVTGAIGAAATVGNFAAKILAKATGDSIGLYRTTWLQQRDRFGVGRHPETGTFRQKDLEFWYEVVLDRKQKGSSAVTSSRAGVTS